MKDKLVNLPIIGKKFLDIFTKSEGGQKTSLTLRHYVLNKYSVEVGMYSYGCCFTPRFNTGGKVVIGNYCSFSTDVCYFGADHPMDHAVMSAYFYNKRFSGLEVKDVPRHTLVVGNDVWVGHGVTIVSSCNSIGNGAVIAAGAVVTKNVPAYAIVAGVPAKVIRYRFTEEIIELIEKSKWWEKKPDQLMNYYEWIETPKEWAEAIIQNDCKN